MTARENKKPQLTAEAADDNSLLVAHDLVQRIGELTDRKFDFHGQN